MVKQNQKITLSDGRLLGYDEYGASDGRPILYFHGAPSSRVEFSLFGSEMLVESLHVRLIAVDRPGMGLSDIHRTRSLLDWPRDVLELADHLQMERFAVLAYSLGGPYGAVCAYSIPERLSKVGIVSGPAPFNEAGFSESMNEGTRRYLSLPHGNPWLGRFFLWMMRATTRLAPSKMVAQAASLLPEPDREIIAKAEMQNGFLVMIQEALRQGGDGAIHEARIAGEDWGFRPQDIRIPVLLWYGEVDKNIPIEMGRYMAEAIPNCQAKFYANEGHLSLFKKNAEEIISSLAS